MKRIVINATQSEEIRVAMVDGQYLYDLDIEHPNRTQKKSNIYKGIITRLEPSLEAAFVNYGADRHGFLPFKEISKDYWNTNGKKIEGRPNIRAVLKEGQELLVQVDKEERGNKGAALTTHISLAGRYLVLMPNNPRAGGVSRRIEGDDRHKIRDILSQLDIPEGMGAIVRTAGVGRELEELTWDMEYLKTLWQAISDANAQHPAPVLLYQESNVIIRALRDYFRNDIGEILIDNERVYQQAHDFISAVMPQNLRKLKMYTDTVPLFSRYQVENQIDSAFHRQVNLPSGGAIVIDHTEALISIDVNSARATRGQGIEETALNTNLEAADEVARQLRLRDLGGLVVIDFIDMLPNRNQREVERRLRDALKMDRARVQVGRISRFGLLEMSRQRLRPSLGESSQIVCPRCSGEGTIRGVESLALSIMRLMEEEAMKDLTVQVVAETPVAVATFLLNEKRKPLNDIQERHGIQMTIIPNPNLETPHYEITRLKEEDVEDLPKTYLRMKQADASADGHAGHAEPTVQAQAQPIVSQVHPATPTPTGSNKPGLITRIIATLFGATKDAEADQPKPVRKPSESRSTSSDRKNTRSGSSNSSNSRSQQSSRNKTKERSSSPKSNAETVDNRNTKRDTAATEESAKAANSGKKSRQSNRNKSSGNTDNAKGPDKQNNTDNRKDSQNTAAPDQEVAKTQESAAPEKTEKKKSSRSRGKSRRAPKETTIAVEQTQSEQTPLEITIPLDRSGDSNKSSAKESGTSGARKSTAEKVDINKPVTSSATKTVESTEAPVEAAVTDNADALKAEATPDVETAKAADTDTASAEVTVETSSKPAKTRSRSRSRKPRSYSKAKAGTQDQTGEAAVSSEVSGNAESETSAVASKVSPGSDSEADATKAVADDAAKDSAVDISPSAKTEPVEVVSAEPVSTASKEESSKADSDVTVKSERGEPVVSAQAELTLVEPAAKVEPATPEPAAESSKATEAAPEPEQAEKEVAEVKSAPEQTEKAAEVKSEKAEKVVEANPESEKAADVAPVTEPVSAEKPIEAAAEPEPEQAPVKTTTSTRKTTRSASQSDAATSADEVTSPAASDSKAATAAVDDTAPSVDEKPVAVAEPVVAPIVPPAPVVSVTTTKTTRRSASAQTAPKAKPAVDVAAEPVEKIVPIIPEIPKSVIKTSKKVVRSSAAAAVATQPKPEEIVETLETEPATLVKPVELVESVAEASSTEGEPN